MSVAYRPIGDCAPEHNDWIYASANRRYFNAGEDTDNWEYIYTADMSNLKDFCGYEYTVGTVVVWSSKYTFYTRTKSEEGEDLVRAIIFGDMGSTNNTDTLDMMKNELNSTDILFHIGDIAYDLHSDNGAIGDTYLN
jgi:alkaline phosphatase D